MSRRPKSPPQPIPAITLDEPQPPAEVTQPAEPAARPIPAMLEDDRVYPFGMFCQIIGISVDTFLRIRKGGKGPRITRFSERCGGVRGRDGKQWLESLAEEEAVADARAKGSAA